MPATRSPETPLSSPTEVLRPVSSGRAALAQLDWPPGTWVFGVVCHQLFVQAPCSADANEINRVSIGSTTDGLTPNHDGSLTLHVQPAPQGPGQMGQYDGEGRAGRA